jgi:hypothetical protein
LVDSMLDAGGNLRWGRSGPLPSIAEDDRQPELVKGWRELTVVYGAFLHDLTDRVAQLAREPSPDERALKAAKLIDDAEAFAAEAARQSQIKIAAMRAAVAGLEERMKAPGGRLPPEAAARLAGFFHGLDAHARAAFLRRAEREGDHGALYAIGDDPLTPYAAPEISSAEMRAVASKIRFPRAAAMAAAYSQLAERAEANIRKIGEAVRAAVQTASAAVDAGKLQLLRRARATTKT